jgi:thiamine-phosphate pyrophosphorylase
MAAAFVRRLDPRLLRLVLVTDGQGDPARIERIVREVVQAGVRCVQLRESQLSARALMHLCERLLPLLDDVQGLLLVNDRVDVAAARCAHGAQVGHRSLPPALARQVLGPHAVLGFSAHEVAELDQAAEAQCDFALLSPAAHMTSRARLPVVWLGGADTAQLAQLADVPAAGRPVGVAVRSAMMVAEQPGHAAAELLRALSVLDAI